MGRVDEAMRRALEAQTGATAEQPAPARAADEPAGLGGAESADESEGGARRLRRAIRPVMAPENRVLQPPSSTEHLAPGLARKVVVDPKMEPLSREQYRRLAATLHQAQVQNDLKVVMVTSALPGEGKTLTATNLALTLSESYHLKVLLIDADLRRPTLHTVFSVDSAIGLVEGLRAEGDQKLSLHRVSPYLTLLPAGQPTSDPMSILTADRMKRVIEEARQMFDWVIVDTPPIGLLPDANLLSAVVDGAIFVVKANETPYTLVQRAIDAVGREHVLGLVLNRATATLPNAGYSYDRYFDKPVRSSLSR